MRTSQRVTLAIKQKDNMRQNSFRRRNNSWLRPFKMPKYRYKSYSRKSRIRSPKSKEHLRKSKRHSNKAINKKIVYYGKVKATRYVQFPFAKASAGEIMLYLEILNFLRIELNDGMSEILSAIIYFGKININYIITTNKYNIIQLNVKYHYYIMRFTFEYGINILWPLDSSKQLPPSSTSINVPYILVQNVSTVHIYLSFSYINKKCERSVGTL